MLRYAEERHDTYKAFNHPPSISEITEKSVAGLAGKPLTLNMLIDVFEKGGLLKMIMTRK